MLFNLAKLQCHKQRKHDTDSVKATLKVWQLKFRVVLLVSDERSKQLTAFGYTHYLPLQHVSRNTAEVYRAGMERIGQRWPLLQTVLEQMDMNLEVDVGDKFSSNIRAHLCRAEALKQQAASQGHHAVKSAV